MFKILRYWAKEYTVEHLAEDFIEFVLTFNYKGSNINSYLGLCEEYEKINQLFASPEEAKEYLNAFANLESKGLPEREYDIELTAIEEQFVIAEGYTFAENQLRYVEKTNVFTLRVTLENNFFSTALLEQIKLVGLQLEKLERNLDNTSDHVLRRKHGELANLIYILGRLS